MALPNNNLLDQINMQCYLADVSTGTPAAYTFAPCKGEVIRLKAVKNATLATTDTIVTVNINGTNITGGTLTLNATGDAAGDTFSTNITNPGITARVNEGDYIGFVSDGGSDNATVPCTFYAVIRQRRG